MKTAEQIKSELQQFTGTEQYHKVNLFPVLVTDGVIHFAQEAQAFWLLDEISAFTTITKEPFIVAKTTSKDGKAKILFEDGNYNNIGSKNINLTDLPEGEWTIWISNYPGSAVIMLPSEY